MISVCMCGRGSVGGRGGGYWSIFTEKATMVQSTTLLEKVMEKRCIMEVEKNVKAARVVYTAALHFQSNGCGM